MKDLEHSKRPIIAILTGFYIMGGFYIGCDSKSPNNIKRSVSAENKAEPKPQLPKSQLPEKNSDSEKNSEDIKDQKSKANERDMNTPKNDGNSQKDKRTSIKSEATSSDPTTNTVKLDFPTRSQQNSFCALSPTEVLNAIKSFGELSNSKLKEISETSIGRALSYDQMKKLKSISDDVGLSDVKDLKYQVCRGDIHDESKEEEDADSDGNADTTGSPSNAKEN